MMDSEKGKPQQEKRDEKTTPAPSDSPAQSPEKDASYAVKSGGSSPKAGLRLVQGFGAVEGSDRHSLDFNSRTPRRCANPVRIWLVPDPSQGNWNKSI